MLKTLVLYSFSELTNNVEHFIKNAVFENRNVDFLFICNNNDLIFNVPNYVKKLYRNNIGFAFGAWSDGLLINNLYKNYDYFIFTNSDISGPYFHINDNNINWINIYLNKLNDDIKIVGSTINTMYNSFLFNYPGATNEDNIINLSHVQTYIFAINKETCDFLIETNIFSQNYITNERQLFIEKEMGMSRVILNNNWNIGCLLKHYNNIDFRFKNKKPKDYLINFYDDIMYPYYNNNLWNNIELVFIKNNTNYVEKLIDTLINITITKYGLEIGGITDKFELIYQVAKNVDNVCLEEQQFKYGKNIINNVMNMSNIDNDIYDFIICNYTFDFISNPLKGLNECIRVIKNNGYIILCCNDKIRTPYNKMDLTFMTDLLNRTDNFIPDLEKYIINYDLDINKDELINKIITDFNNNNLMLNFFHTRLLKDICIHLKCKLIFEVSHNYDFWIIIQKIIL